MEDVDIYVLLPFGPLYCHFGIFYGYLVHFSHFCMLYQEKSGNPGGHIGRYFALLAVV
jgi:hypothetical protein